MIKRAEIARSLAFGYALWSVSVAGAQDRQPAGDPVQQSATQGFFVVQGVISGGRDGQSAGSDKAATSTINPFTGGANVLQAEGPEAFRQQFEARRKKLQAQLADPKQRAAIIADRIVQQRSLHRDLAAILRLDARTEDRLLALLADLQLTEDLASYPGVGFANEPIAPDGKPYNPMRAEAQRYTQRMVAITKIIGAVRLDDYVDYEHKLGERSLIDELDRSLPDAGKLTLEQRNSLVDLCYEQAQNRLQSSQVLEWPFSFDLTLSEQERNRRMLIANITSNERFAKLEQAANREIVDRAASFLTPEQLTALTQWKQRQLDQQLAWARTQRQELGIGPEEQLDAPDTEIASPPISKNLQITIDLTVNDTRLIKQLTSVRGSTIAFEAPEGLLVEIRPYMVHERLMAELQLYEKVRGGRRQLGRMTAETVLTDANKGVQLGSNSTLVQGRKGYAVNWSVSGKYL